MMAISPNAGHVGSHQGAQVFIDTRLDTWKSVAQYLGRSCRTVQRWHSEYGLPVHHLGGDASSVFAYTDELDRWLRQRGRTISEHASDPPQASHPPREGVIKDESVRLSSTSSPEWTPDAARIRSAGLVARAQRLWQSLSAVNLSAIARLYREAIDLDDSNALAFAGLSQALIAQGVLGKLHPSVAFRPAEAALRRALEVDHNLFEVRCAAAMLKMFVERDWNAARTSLQQAAFEHPTATQPLIGCGFLAIAENSLAKASEFFRRALFEWPLNTSAAELVCWVEYLSGRFESALALIADSRETGHDGAILDTVAALCEVLLYSSPSQVKRLESQARNSRQNVALLGVLGFSYGKLGQTTAARQVIRSMTHLGLIGTDDYAYPIALTHLGLNEHNEAINWLDQSYRHGSVWSLAFSSDPILEVLRTNPLHRAFFESGRYPQCPVSLRSSEASEPPVSRMPFSA